MSRLSWRREPRRPGLSGVCQGERGFDLCFAGINIARVRPIESEDRKCYYFVARADNYSVPLHNSYANQELYDTPEEAKKACSSYVKKHFVRDGA